MYDKAHNNAGVLNDFDLATVDGESSPSGSERTGTVPFMALDLINPKNPPGSVRHEYRHDCESFVWTLLWIFGNYEDGKELPTRPSDFEDWLGLRSFEAKNSAMNNFQRLPRTKTFDNFWPRLRKMLMDVHRDYLLRSWLGPGDDILQSLQGAAYEKRLYEKLLWSAESSLDDVQQAISSDIARDFS